MKLYINENLKRLRIARGITQKQLAEDLGASMQSVSRWEIGSSYPDVEMIPVIAGYFGVSVDELMGVNKAEREEQLKKDYETLGTLHNRRERADHLRKMYSEHPDNPSLLLDLICELSDLQFRGNIPEVYAEQKKLTNKLLNMEGVDRKVVDLAVFCMVGLAPENELPELLDRYGSELDMRREMLIEGRVHYIPGGNCKLGQYILSKLLTDSINRMDHTKEVYTERDGNVVFDLDGHISSIKRRLAMIDFLTGTSGMNQISGDGEPDLWFKLRIENGYSLAASYVTKERFDEALFCIEEIADLFEKFYSMQDGTVLTYRCPELDLLSLTWYSETYKPEGTILKYYGKYGETAFKCKRASEPFFGVDLYYDPKTHNTDKDRIISCPVEDMIPMFHSDCSYTALIPIRDHPRFRAAYERMAKYIVPVCTDSLRS